MNLRLVCHVWGKFLFSDMEMNAQNLCDIIDGLFLSKEIAKSIKKN